MIVTAGKLNVSAYFYIVQDASAASPGEPVTGLLFSDIETGGSASYVRQGAARTDLTLITLASASAAHADGGFILVDDTNLPGVYRCDYPDAAFAFALGVDEVTLGLVVASAKNAVVAPIKVQLDTAPGLKEIDTGTSPTATTLTLKSGSLAENGDIVHILKSGNGVRGTRIINTFNGGTEVATFAAIWDTTPTTPITYALFASPLAETVTVGSMDPDVVDSVSLATSAADEIASGVADEVLTGGTHNIADSLGRRLRDLQEFGTYDGGAIWVDTVNGSPGTTDFESGTFHNPVNTMADANTLAASLGISKFQILAGSTITLVATQQNQVFDGENWTLALGGQDIAGSHFTGADVSGIATGTGTEQDFHNCHMSTTTHIDNTFLIECGIVGTQTLPAGDVFFHQCFMATTAGVVPIVDFGAAVLNTNVHLHDWRGRIEFQNLGQAGTDAIHLDGQGKVTFNANCVGGTIDWRGAFELVNNGSGITINDDARYDQAQVRDAILAAIIEGTITFKQSIALQNAASAGKLSGGGSGTNLLRDLADTLDRITASVDLQGNRTAITTDFTDL